MNPNTPHPSFPRPDLDIPSFASLGGVITPVELNDPTGLFPFYNPSLIDHKGQTLMLIRSCSYTYPVGSRRSILTHMKKPVTHTLLAVLENPSEGLTEPLRAKRVKMIGLPPATEEQGLEDARFMVIKGALFLVGVVHPDPLNPTVPHVGLLSLDLPTLTANYVKTLSKPTPGRPEKNWIPMEGTDRLSYSPTQIISLEGQIDGESYSGLLHNTSNAVRIPGGTCVSVLHSIKQVEVIDSRGRVSWEKEYVHYFAFHYKSGQVKQITPGFKLHPSEPIEFVSGLRYDKKSKALQLAMGVGDRSLAFGNIPLEKVKAQAVHYTQLAEETLIGKRFLTEPLTPSFSARIVTHPARLDRAKKLQAYLRSQGFAEVMIFNDDEQLGAALNHFRACATPTMTTHVLVLEDDCLPVEGFKPKVQAHTQTHPREFISFYLGQGRPQNIQPRIAKLLAMEPKSPTIQLPNLLGGLCYTFPAFMSEHYAKATPWDRQFADYSVGKLWRRFTNRNILYTKKSLVQHDDLGSLHTPGRPEPLPRIAWELDGQVAY